MPGAKLDPWLIVGKGPSFSSRARYDFSRYAVMTLNDAICEVTDTEADVAHFIDLEAFLRCLPVLRRRPNVMIALPWRPHVRFKPSAHSLGHHVVEEKLQDLEDRILYYHSSTAGVRRSPEGAPIVEVKYFSAEAALSLLALGGAKVVRTLGVDGGTQYAREFSGLQPLENGRRSFDLQFPRMRATAKKFRVNFRALGEADW